jgi:hypothetical protein
MEHAPVIEDKANMHRHASQTKQGDISDSRPVYLHPVLSMSDEKFTQQSVVIEIVVVVCVAGQLYTELLSIHQAHQSPAVDPRVISTPVQKWYADIPGCPAWYHLNAPW